MRETAGKECEKQLLKTAKNGYSSSVEGIYLPRVLDQNLADRLDNFPALLISGPRAAGKTTSAMRLAASMLRLDTPAVAEVVRADPDAALRRMEEPLLLDEWQEVPTVLGAVKRAVDADPRPGRFLLTGSVEADLAAATWPGTGRVVRSVMYPLACREIDGAGDGGGLLPILLAGSLDDVRVPPGAPDVDEYVDLALRGGFPEPVFRLSERLSREWYDGYVDQIVTRDAKLVAGRRPALLRQYLEVLALSTAGLPADTTLFEGAGINKDTARGYDDLLQSLFVYEPVRAWLSNRLNRLLKRPKRYVLDVGVAAAAGRFDATAILGDADLLGRTLDTFVAAQIRPELVTVPGAPRLHHLRAEGGRRESDLVLDAGNGRIVGIEVKASSAPTSRDARHLAWLRDQLGDRFVRGVVFHTGPLPFELDERIWALPICAFWARSADGFRVTNRLR